ncbi:MAG: FecR domain-containing protein [Bacteroidetes bacterium]|nr:FecR domain-containing protein [Bacteroidota bacterium]
MTYTDDMHPDEDWKKAWEDPEEIDPAKKKVLLDRLHRKMDGGVRRLLLTALSAAAAVLVLFFARTLLSPAPVPEAQWREIASNTGMLRVVLDDSSILCLAPHSSLRVCPAFTTHRNVALTKGFAFFEVAKDERHAFTVAAGRQKVTVLGTSFSVRRLDSVDIHLMVRDGKVGLDGREVLTAGQEITTTAGIGGRIGQVDAAATDWWLQQQVRWHNIALGDLLQRLENYYQIKLTYGTIDKKMKVTLTWDMGISLEENLGLLNTVTGYNIH